MQHVNRRTIIPRVLVLAVGLALGTGASACRLQANNTDKLNALKAGKAYGEEIFPVVAITAPSDGSYINASADSASFVVSGTCNIEGATVTLDVDDAAASSLTGGSCDGTTWAATFSTLDLNSGSHLLRASLAVASGTSSASEPVTLIKDTAAPAASISSPAPSSYVNLGSDSPTFAIQGSCTTATENGRAVTIQINGVDASQSAITCGGSDTWAGTIDTTALGEATHTLTAKLTDAAGNTGTSPATLVTKDVTRPSVTLTYPLSGITINPSRISTTYPVKGTCSENSRAISITVDGSAAVGVASDTCTSGAFSATIDVSGLDNATHTISATQTDAAGNSGPSTAPSASVTKDTTLAMGGTFARTSAANDPFTMAQAASGVARYSTVSSSTGIMIEEGTTNLLPNSNGSGGSGTTLPTGWFHQYDVGLGITYNVVADPSYSGHQAVEITVSNTSGSDKSYRLFFAQTASIAASATEQFTASLSLELVSGSLTGVGTQIGTHWYSTGGGAYLNENGKYIAVTSSRVRVTSDALTAPANTGYTTPRLAFYSVPNGASFVMRVVAPQLEKKAYATSYLATGGASATRAAESLSIPTNGSFSPSHGAFVIRAYVDGELTQSTMSRQYWLLFGNNPTGNQNRISLLRTTNGQYQALTADSAGNLSIAASATAKNLSKGWHSFGIRWNSSELALWIDGTKQPVVIANPNLVTAFASELKVGDGSGGLQWNQPIDSVATYQHSPSDAEMAAYTTTGPTDSDNRYDFSGAAFTRSDVAYSPVTGVSSATGAPRYATKGGATGIVLEETTSNILSANQSDVETGTGGFNSNNGAALSRDTTTAWSGSSSLKIEGDGSSAYEGTFFYASVTSGQTYTLSAWLKGSGTVNMSWTGVGGTSTLTLTDEWKRYSFTGTATSTGSATLLVKTVSAQAVTYWVDGLQFEQKAYATGWHLGGGTRNNEQLTVPAASVATASSGKLRARFMLLRDPGTNNQTIIDLGGTGVNGLYLSVSATNGNVLRLLAGNGTAGVFATGTTALVKDTWYTVEGAWNSSQIQLTVNDTVEATTATTPSVVLNANAMIGYSTSGNRYLDGILDWAEFEDSAGKITRFDFNNSLGQ